MKKQNKNKNNRQNDFSSLNSELGSFDLEPPKHYRDDGKKQPQKRSNAKKGSQTNQQKRNAQKKKRKRSKIFYRVLSITAIVLAILAVIITLSLTVFFKIEKINIKGNIKYSEEQIVDNLPIEKEKNLFMVDIDEAELTLEKELPYIFKAEIKRKLPNEIVVSITETPKVYSIKKKDKTYILLDENLKVLEAEAKEKPKGSIAIANSTVKSVDVGKQIKLDDEKVLNNLLKLTDIINSLKLDEITAISVIDVNTSSMIYDGRITIKLGSIDNLENKVYSALTAIDRLNETNPNEEGIITATNDKQIYFTEK